MTLSRAAVAYLSSLLERYVMHLIKSTVVTLLLTVLWGCGGGGGGVTTPITQTSGFSQTYTSSLSMGDVVNMTVDTANNTFSYTVIKSQYGCEITSAQCHSDSGSISKASDGTYSGTGSHSSIKFFALENGSFVGKLTIIGFPEVQIVGVANPLTQSPHVGTTTLNFIGNFCQSANRGVRDNTCADKIGTLKMGNMQYSMCIGDDIDKSTPSCTTANGKLTTGTISQSDTAGVWLFNKTGSNSLNYLIGFKAPNNQVIAIIDFNDGDVGGYGYGQITASSKEAVTPALRSTNAGDWLLYGLANAGAIVFTANADGTGQQGQTYTPNAPWDGFLTSSDTGVLIMAGTGVVMYGKEGGHNNYMIGMKIK